MISECASGSAYLCFTLEPIQAPPPLASSLQELLTPVDLSVVTPQPQPASTPPQICPCWDFWQQPGAGGLSLLRVTSLPPLGGQGSPCAMPGQQRGHCEPPPSTMLIIS